MLQKRVSIPKSAEGLQHELTILRPEERMDTSSIATCHTYGKSHENYCIGVLMLLGTSEQGRRPCGESAMRWSTSNVSYKETF